MAQVILAIDPGTFESQFLLWDGNKVQDQGFRANGDLLTYLNLLTDFRSREVIRPCIEMVASFGMPVGHEVFETVYWIGRFDERLRSFGYIPQRMLRQEVKLHLCHSARAKDGNIRQALIDRFGGKEAAIGKKAKPGPLFGISGHAWAALALAVTFGDRK